MLKARHDDEDDPVIFSHMDDDDDDLDQDVQDDADQEVNHQVPNNASLSLDTATTFRDDVRSEWIHAVFGSMSCPPHAKVHRGMGLAQIAPFTAYRVCLTTPSNSSSSHDKLGISISRLALGLYVRHIEPGSEAWCAGILVHSVLVAINGMSLLAEPSKQALERLWQYEGHVQHQTCIRQPLHMTLIHQGQLYSVVLLANPPYGIDWAPCGNFALVKRSYAMAEQAGVVRGSLIAAVDDKDLNELDHTVAAATLRALTLQGKEEIQMTLCIPPSEARSGHLERLLVDASNNNSSNNKNESSQQQQKLVDTKVHRPQATAALDGVEVRVHPLFCTNAASPPRALGNPSTTSSSTTTTSTTFSSAATSLSQLAFRVAAGELFSFAPQTRRRGNFYYLAHHHYRECPPLDRPLTEVLLPSQALAFLLKYNQAKFDERNLLTASNNTVYSFLQMQSYAQARQSVESYLIQLLALLRTDNDKAFKSFLLELATPSCTMAEDSDDDIINLAHCMEFMAQALEVRSVKEPLAVARRKRVQQQAAATSLLSSSGQQQPLQPSPIVKRQPRQIPIRVERAPDERLKKDSSPVAAASTATGTTASAVTFSTISSGVSALAASRHYEPNKMGGRKTFFGLFKRRKAKKNTKLVLEHETIRGGGASTKFPEAAPSSTLTATTSATNGHAAAAAAPLAKSSASTMIGPSRPRQRHKKNSEFPRKDVLFANTLRFLEELEAVCLDIEKSLLRSFSQKVTAWALQPWSASKETELAQVTSVLRERLAQYSILPLLNPIDAGTLTAVDAQGSYILPSAHFPLLLTFDCQVDDDEFDNEEKEEDALAENATRKGAGAVFGKEKLYRTKVELIGLEQRHQQTLNSTDETAGWTFSVHGSVGGIVMESGASIATNRSSDRHVWDQGNILSFDTRSSWGAPATLSLLLTQSNDKIIGSDETGKLQYDKEIGYGFVDLAGLWQTTAGGEKAIKSYTLQVWSFQDEFDEHGDLPGDGPAPAVEEIQIQIKVTLQIIPLTGGGGGLWSQKRLLLYKHDDDVRQELFAIEFVKSCDAILKSCGLNLKLLTFRCIPVGKRRGFIEWVQGSVPLSEICQPFAGSILDASSNKKDAPVRTMSNVLTPKEEDPLSSVAKAGLTKYESLRRINKGTAKKYQGGTATVINPIQDYLRAFHFSENDPYMIRKRVMETYVKSCAGYCVITYILGVGDRHLDNLLLHPTGHFFHCDYSFILGHDPKKYLPLRITEDMVNGMGGRESDNYAMFLSLTCAAFLTFRRPENVRHLLSFARLMEGCCSMPMGGDSSQTLESAMMEMRERLRLDLSDDEAISFMEKLIEESCSSRMWIAVDAIHTLGKRF